MKILLLTTLLLFAYDSNCGRGDRSDCDVKNSALAEWIERLNRIPLPDSIRKDNLINVYFKYNRPINGYEVTARWMPFDSTSETGYVVMNFRNLKNGSSFQYVNFEKYNSFNTDEVAFAVNFKGHRNGDVYYFDYPAPETELCDGLYQLGYTTPFQLLDVDFDGDKELLISDWARARGGNHYDVYNIRKSGLELITYTPLDLLTTDARINPGKKKHYPLIRRRGLFQRRVFLFQKKSRPKQSRKTCLAERVRIIDPGEICNIER